ncbi:S-adenosyl-L-methionine-dependent methyltransferase [Naviculisporaceae sp. PSN 640]
MTSPNQPPRLPSEGGDPADTSPIQKAEEIGRLQSTFQNRSFNDHPSAWDALWNEAYTPWDRGGPSLALKDLLSQHPDLFPFQHQASGEKNAAERPKALVPGCGRGHDVLLLSSLGFDAYGLDFSEKAIQEAKVNEKEFLNDNNNNNKAEQDKERGTVTWLAGDFFDASLLETQTGVDKFDLLFDYTFFCALPPSARPKWATRVSSLLKPQTGCLICLEWPLHKPAKTGGPPWGVTAQVYLAHLSHPDEPLPYDDEGNLIIDDKLAKELEGGNGTGQGLERIARVRPTRTHKAGYDPDGNMIDFISVWKARSP